MKSVAVHRPDTLTAHQTSVAKVIVHMKTNISKTWDADLTLDSLSHIGCYSKSHFIDVFKSVTGISPRLFLAALRIQSAKTQLLKTSVSVTQICLDSGYSSMGTFSRIFHALVGIPPVVFRRAATSYTSEAMLRDALEFCRENRPDGKDVVEGYVSDETISTGTCVIFIGAFRKQIPQGYPLAGTVLLGPGPFRLRKPTSGSYCTLAIRMPLDVAPFAPDQNEQLLRVARSNHRPNESGLTLQLRPVDLFDPPLVIALPRLFRAKESTW